MEGLKDLEKKLKRISPYFEMEKNGDDIFLCYNFSERGGRGRDVIAMYGRINPREIFHDADKWLRLLKRFKLREFSLRR